MFKTQHLGSYTDSSNSEVYSIKTTIMGNNDSRYVGGKRGVVKPILGVRETRCQNVAPNPPRSIYIPSMQP